MTQEVRLIVMFAENKTTIRNIFKIYQFFTKILSRIFTIFHIFLKNFGCAVNVSNTIYEIFMKNNKTVYIATNQKDTEDDEGEFDVSTFNSEHKGYSFPEMRNMSMEFDQ